jgi:hypothetical protein
MDKNDKVTKIIYKNVESVLDFGHERVEAVDDGHELGPVLVEEIVFKLESHFGEIRQRLGTLDVEHRVEKISPQFVVPPPKN